MPMMGELSYFLRLQVKQMKNDIFLSQTKYYKDIMKKFEMENCKEVATPMSTSYYMDVDLAERSVDQTNFKGLIGSLLYLIASKPNIMFVVCLCARFQSNLKESHFTVAKTILKYLKGTNSVGIWYPFNSFTTFIGYSDSDFTRCKLDMKSTSGTFTYLVPVSSPATRNKLVLLTQLQKLSILLIEVVVHKSYGSNNNFKIMV